MVSPFSAPTDCKFIIEKQRPTIDACVPLRNETRCCRLSPSIIINRDFLATEQISNEQAWVKFDSVSFASKFPLLFMFSSHGYYM